MRSSAGLMCATWAKRNRQAKQTDRQTDSQKRTSDMQSTRTSLHQMTHHSTIVQVNSMPASLQQRCGSGVRRVILPRAAGWQLTGAHASAAGCDVRAALHDERGTGG
eukprot:PLAT9129.4.p2 GENE.PLAT9129.4~~PLAT9129.4.p2  ORF type:complete len:107 (+),score=2.15 PLAT9129.4:371-691(+)